MTIIAYYRQSLLADQLHMNDVDDGGDFVSFGEKLHLSNDKRIAFASCGAAIHKKDLEQVTQWLHALMEEFEKTHKAPDLNDEVKDTYLYGRKFLVMSSNYCLSLCHYSGTALLDPDDVAANGSGKMPFLTAAAAGLDIDKIVPFVATMLGSVSPQFNRVDQLDLIPFTFLNEETQL